MCEYHDCVTYDIHAHNGGGGRGVSENSHVFISIIRIAYTHVSQKQTSASPVPVITAAARTLEATISVAATMATKEQCVTKVTL